MCVHVCLCVYVCVWCVCECLWICGMTVCASRDSEPDRPPLFCPPIPRGDTPQYLSDITLAVFIVFSFKAFFILVHFHFILLHSMYWSYRYTLTHFYTFHFLPIFLFSFRRRTQFAIQGKEKHFTSMKSFITHTFKTKGLPGRWENSYKFYLLLNFHVLIRNDSRNCREKSSLEPTAQPLWNSSTVCRDIYIY